MVFKLLHYMNVLYNVLLLDRCLNSFQPFILTKKRESSVGYPCTKHSLNIYLEYMSLN